MKHASGIAAVLLMIGLLVSPVLVQAVEFEPGITLINTAEVKAKMDAGEDMLLINTLSPIEIKDKTIPGSVGMPYEHIRDGRIQLPDQKDRMLVFYCKGPK